MRAARQGIALDRVEVSVDAKSDGRGMFMDEGISPGSSEIQIHFKIGAKDVSREQLQELIDWVVQHSSVGTDAERAIDVSVDLEAL